MRIDRALVFGSVLAVAAVGGCRHAQTPEQLTARLRSADRLSAKDQRDDALASIARDAAYSSEPKMCLEAFNHISSRDLQDRTARDCAVELDKQGRRETAEALADRISDARTREDLRRQFAHKAPDTVRPVSPQDPATPQGVSTDLK